MKTAQDIGSAKGDRAKRGSASSEQGSTFYDIFRFIGGGINEYIMNKYFILLLLMCFSHSIMGQTEERNDTVLQGRICDVVKIKLFPLINDSILKTNNYPIIFPLLIVNDVPIRDEKKVRVCLKIIIIKV